MTPRAPVTNPASGAAKARERVEELRKWLTVMERDNWSYPTRLASADLLAIIEDYSALKARAEKAEAALVDEQKRRAAIAESLQAHQDELAKQAPLIEAANKWDGRVADWASIKPLIQSVDDYRAALKLREEKK